MSPIKIVKNPDGSMQRAAMTQSALSKERRGWRAAAAHVIEAIPKDLSRPWEDPLADASGVAPWPASSAASGSARPSPRSGSSRRWARRRMFPASATAAPSRSSARSLPIFKLSEQLVQAVADNQVRRPVRSQGCGGIQMELENKGLAGEVVLGGRVVRLHLVSILAPVLSPKHAPCTVQILVVIGETGSGKTTQMTQCRLAEAGLHLPGQDRVHAAAARGGNERGRARVGRGRGAGWARR